MPTPLDAPYKLAQAEAERALRGSRRTARIDRAALLMATVRAAAATKRGERGAAKRLHSLWCMLTRAERLALASGVARSPKD